MKNKKIRGWIILILIVIAGIIALLVALKCNKKESFDQVTNADGAIVKENVQVINEENAPDQVTENTLVYISNNPKYKKVMCWYLELLMAQMLDLFAESQM